MPIGNGSEFTNSSLVALNNLLKNTKCVGVETLTVAGTAVGFASIPDTATSAIFILESTITSPTVAIRFWETGQLPTTTVGMPRLNLDVTQITNRENLLNFRVIQTGGGTHTLSIEYYA